jgi:hypothetical protein
MEETKHQEQLPLPEEKISAAHFALDVLQGVGVMIGLAILWLFEGVRNLVFRLFDRFNLRAHVRKKVSAFPPGSPRRHKVA